MESQQSAGKILLLGYWAIRGDAERIRFLLQYLQLPYKEIRYTLETQNQWFEVTKPELQKKNPAISLPYLIDDDKVITESEAIMIYLIYKAKRPQLLGSTPDQKVKMATILGIYRDMHNSFLNLCYGRYDQTKHFQTARDQVIKKQFNPQIKKLTEMLYDRDFICGYNVTYADFIVCQFLQILFVLCPFMQDNNIIISHYQRMLWELPEIQKYLKSGRYFRRPYNGSSAVWR